MMRNEIWNKQSVNKLTIMAGLVLTIAIFPPSKSNAGNIVGTVDSVGYYRRQTIQNWELMKIRIKNKNEKNE